MKRIVMLCVLLALVVSACGPNNTANNSNSAAQAPPEATDTLPPPPTDTPVPTETPAPTDTPVPTATPIPGEEVVPLTSLGNSVPWMELVPGRVPMSIFYGFNINKAPFDDVLVRKAFAAATDREAIAAFVGDYFFAEAQPATTIIPSSVLGRYLYGDVGIPFDPDTARDYLAQAGFPGGEGFPEVTIITYQRGEAAPSTYYRIATDVVIPLWEEILGVKVNVIAFPQGFRAYQGELERRQPDFYIIGWGADLMDPTSFMLNMFNTGGDFNIGGYSNPDFDNLIFAAENVNDPAKRQLMYIDAERILCEVDVAVIPLFYSLFYFNN